MSFPIALRSSSEPDQASARRLLVSWRKRPSSRSRRQPGRRRRDRTALCPRRRDREFHLRCFEKRCAPAFLGMGASAILADSADRDAVMASQTDGMFHVVERYPIPSRTPVAQRTRVVLLGFSIT